MSYTGIMAHLVCHYPDSDRFWEVARGIIEGGAAALELQFPFSDPTADGPAIQQACSDALEAGFTLSEGFAVLRRLRELTDRPIFLMTYANIPMVKGIDAFVGQARDAGATGLIVPDLPIDDDEGLIDAATHAGVGVVPVVVPSLSQERRRRVESLRPHYLYVALRSGTTGKETAVTDEQLSFLEWAGGASSEIMAGFGIRRADQVRLLSSHVSYAVVGSAIVSLVAKTAESGASPGDLRRAVACFLGELSGV